MIAYWPVLVAIAIATALGAWWGWRRSRPQPEPTYWKVSYVVYYADPETDPYHNSHGGLQSREDCDATIAEIRGAYADRYVLRVDFTIHEPL